MAVQLTLDYDQIVQLVEQLTEEQQKDLISRLLMKRATERPLTVEEKIQLLNAAQISKPVNEQPSDRREDWYGDDGR